ncbi:hypothetical protein JZ751_000883 [Albula glossodonta]|uniref:Uncharacterized protein n=1 Tax=Albula glossodonta TaxID=121402 RepID=A0A8T2PXB0_9TELE|nr:hypothetical protein JZ751_000883 [Albula glossodonta]
MSRESGRRSGTVQYTSALSLPEQRREGEARHGNGLFASGSRQPTGARGCVDMQRIWARTRNAVVGSGSGGTAEFRCSGDKEFAENGSMFTCPRGEGRKDNDGDWLSGSMLAEVSPPASDAHCFPLTKNTALLSRLESDKGKRSAGAVLIQLRDKKSKRCRV